MHGESVAANNAAALARHKRTYDVAVKGSSTMARGGPRLGKRDRAAKGRAVAERERKRNEKRETDI